MTTLEAPTEGRPDGANRAEDSRADSPRGSGGRARPGADAHRRAVASARPAGDDPADGKTGPAVRLDHVSKSYGTHRVLEDVSFEVPAGAGFVILGRSGTGKSVTLRHIIGLVQPDQGRVFVGADEISALKGSELSRVRRRLGFLFQNAALFDSISVGENVAFPMRRHTDLGDADIVARARDKLTAVGLEKEFDKMPAALSGGMRKRAGLARALALDPEILLVDEPSAGLDPITAAEIDQLLLHLKEGGGTTLIVVTHNIPSARKLGDELAMLHEGKILARGSAEDLERSENAMVRAFMTAQHAG
jgi:phospholipid/cholesterol/gamma-HCH transport system ATP-binding protein